VAAETLVLTSAGSVFGSTFATGATGAGSVLAAARRGFNIFLAAATTPANIGLEAARRGLAGAFSAGGDLAGVELLVRPDVFFFNGINAGNLL
jgi:hypothetical protein